MLAGRNRDDSIVSSRRDRTRRSGLGLAWSSTSKWIGKASSDAGQQLNLQRLQTHEKVPSGSNPHQTHSTSPRDGPVGLESTSSNTSTPTSIEASTESTAASPSSDWTSSDSSTASPTFGGSAMTSTTATTSLSAASTNGVSNPTSNTATGDASSTALTLTSTSSIAITSAFSPAPSLSTVSPSSSNNDVVRAHRTNKGAIAGGVVGGAVFLLLLVIAALLFLRRRRRKRMPASTEFRDYRDESTTLGSYAVAHSQSSHAPLDMEEAPGADMVDPPPAFSEGGYSDPLFEKLRQTREANKDYGLAS